MVSFLDFEKPIAALQARVTELRETADEGALDIDAEIQRLQARSDKMLADTYAKLTPWQKTQVARHPERPHFKHYVAGIFDEFIPLAGDRAFGDDQAILRSEEHTSELQSLMRISYAVFCLKKKNNQITIESHDNI